ncbi:MAG: hypothetical protein J6P16_05050 [Eubacterium sp.]|nr:hypothetical protein [Eubacterium sp.]
MKKKMLAKKIIPATALTLALAVGTISMAGCGSPEKMSVAAADTSSASSGMTMDTPPGDPPSGSGNGMGTPPDGGSGGPGGSGSTNVSWTAAATISDSNTYKNKTYSSSTSGQNALMISGDGITPTLDGITASKTGDGSNGDESSFYGTNSAIIAKDGAVVTIKNATVTTESDGANGVFSYGGNGGKNGASGDGTTVNISDSKITTTGGGSGGIMTTGGGVTNATNLTVETSGTSSAAIRTDRGGGTVNVDGGTYTTNGTGSPAIYSTAAVSVKNATLVSNTSEGVCIEGTNSVGLTNCTLTANNTKKNGNAQYLDTIMIYQSMSGDADGTDSSFTMTGGTLNSKSGHVFHVTNTSAEINLNGVKINNTDSEGILMSVVNDGWSGAENNAKLNATSQNLEGKIIVSNTASSKSSSKSTLALNIDKDSTFIGMVGDENGSGTALGTVNVTLDGGWKLTADSYVTSISGTGTIDYNGHTLYVNGTAYTSGTPGGSIVTGTVTPNENAASTDTGVSSGSDETTVNTTTVKKATRSKNRKKITVKVAKTSDADGYEIQYSTSAAFKAKKTKVVTTASSKAKLKSLKKKKNYYIRVRAYKTVNGEKVYSEWSEAVKA